MVGPVPFRGRADETAGDKSQQRQVDKPILGWVNAPPNTAVFRKLPSTLLSLCLCGASVALALDEPAPAQPLKDTGGETGSRVAAETAAAIEALGTNPGTRQISTIVFKAVRSSPENVLLIVHAAARVSPKAAVPEIVTAATAAVPNPWKQVTYRRLAALDRKRSEPDYKGGPDGKQARDGWPNMDLGGRGVQGTPSRGTGDPGANSANGNQMTLAEAIAHTAFDAQPGLSFPSLQAAVDIALRSDPATLLRDVQSSRAISGVGDAGTGNYANEPLRTPKQPVVSR